MSDLGFDIKRLARNGFNHTRHFDFKFDLDKKIIKIYAAGCDIANEDERLGDVNITISDWWSLEVIDESHLSNDKLQASDFKEEVVTHEEINTYGMDNTVTGIIDFYFKNNDTEFCIHFSSGFSFIDDRFHSYIFKFTKPKIKVTGLYDPDLFADD